jgi:hypothetical protein
MLETHYCPLRKSLTLDASVHTHASGVLGNLWAERVLCLCFVYVCETVFKVCANDSITNINTPNTLAVMDGRNSRFEHFDFINR